MARKSIITTREPLRTKLLKKIYLINLMQWCHVIFLYLPRKSNSNTYSYKLCYVPKTWKESHFYVHKEREHFYLNGKRRGKKIITLPKFDVHQIFFKLWLNWIHHHNQWLIKLTKRNNYLLDSRTLEYSRAV